MLNSFDSFLFSSVPSFVGSVPQLTPLQHVQQMDFTVIPYERLSRSFFSLRKAQGSRFEESRKHGFPILLTQCLTEYKMPSKTLKKKYLRYSEC